MTVNAYKSLKRRDKISIDGRGGNGREVLIQYETLPSKWKAKVDEKYEDVYKYAAAQIIKPHLVCSKRDRDTIKDFVTGKEQPLPLHTQEKYKEACSYLALMANTKTAKDIKKLGFPNKGRFTETIQYLIKTDKVDLPANYSNLRAKLKAYEAEGATAVISSKWGNSNSEKITNEIERWAILQMCSTRLSAEMIHTRYLSQADDLGFRADISAEAFKHRLSQPHIAQLINLKRYGKKAVRSKMGQTFKLIPPVYSDDFWQGDGSAIDLAFRNDEGKIGMATVYIVVDVLSETMLGWDISNGLNKENFQMQLRAYRSAVRNTNSQPYQLKYDNQGGHKKEEAKRFYDSLADVHFPSRAYRSSSRRVEGIFGRIQKQILAAYPFWTGFGRHTHSNLAHGHDREKMQRNINELPNFDELVQLWNVIAARWNAAPRKKGDEVREAIYAQSKDPKAKSVELTDMMEMFFNVSEPIRYQKDGISLTRDKMKRTYVVYNDQGLEDYDFRERYMKARFHIKYDPEFEYPNVELLLPTANGDMIPIATAEPKKAVNDVVKQIQPGERAYVDAELKNEADYFDRLENRAAELGYNEKKVMTAWKDDIKPNRLKRQTVPVDGPASPPTKRDFLEQN